MITVQIEMDMVAVATMTYPDTEKNQIIALADGRDRDKIIENLVVDPLTATSMKILSAVDDHGHEIMGNTLVDPNYADAGSFLEAALMVHSSGALAAAIDRLLMTKEFKMEAIKALLKELDAG